MTDWLVYHSQKTMGHSYASLARHAVYSRSQQRKLCLNDWIWVVEGSTDIPDPLHARGLLPVRGYGIPALPRALQRFCSQHHRQRVPASSAGSARDD